MEGDSVTGLDWGRYLKRLTPEQAALINEDEYGITEESYDKLTEAGFQPTVTEVDTRGKALAFVDPAMRDVVVEIDKLPFMKSNNGCSGHGLENFEKRIERLKTRPDYDPKMEEERRATVTPYLGAYQHVYLDDRDSRSYQATDRILRELHQFSELHPELWMEFSFGRDKRKPGVIGFGVRWDVKSPEGWLKKHKGLDDLPYPETVAVTDAEALLQARDLKYPFDDSGMNPWLLYEYIYLYQYHDFYMDNQDANKQALRRPFDILKGIVIDLMKMGYDGEPVKAWLAEMHKYPTLERVIEILDEQERKRPGKARNWHPIEELGDAKER